MTEANKTVNVNATEVTEDPTLLMSRIALSQFDANASLDYPDSYCFSGFKADGSMVTVTLTSSIELSKVDQQWFNLTVGYVTSVKASSLDKSPLVVDGKNYKRPSQKLTIVKPLVTFRISRLGVISNDQVTTDWITDSGLGRTYGSLVFPYLQEMLTKWSNPLTLLFLMLFTQASKEQDTNDLDTTTYTADYKPLAYKPLSSEQRLLAIVKHHDQLVKLGHGSAGNFALTASKARKVLDKFQANNLTASPTIVTPEPKKEVTKADITQAVVHQDGQVTTA